MMKRIVVTLLLALLYCGPALALLHRGPSLNISLGASEIVPNGMSAEFPMLNLMKTQAQGWATYPDTVDSNGYPLTGAAFASVTSNVTIPSSFVVSGHYVLTATGQGAIGGVVPGPTNTAFSCSGTLSGTTCNNTSCASFTGSIAGTTLTVTSAPSAPCTLGAGVPITGTGVAVNKWGVPVFITSAGSACSANTCYTINQSLSVGSETMTMGIRYEFTFSNYDGAGINFGGSINYQASISASQSGNPIQNIALVPIGDEANYWASVTPCGSGQACIIGSAFKTRIKQGGWSVMRDLNWLIANVTTCTTWASRKPISYFSYNTGEIRNAAAGTYTYTVKGSNYTIPLPGQYVNAGGTGASTGTVSYNAGTDTYSITLNSGNFVDKQTFEVLIPTTGTTSSRISMNGNASVPILSYAGGSLAASFYPAPTATQLWTFVYDADLGGAIATVNAPNNGNNGINCGMPPEVFIEIAAELNITPWHVLPYLALDPMTDWTEQFATYLKANYNPTTALAGPTFEVQNEAFNCGTISPGYLSNKSGAHVTADTNHAWTSASAPNCGTGNNASEIGKMASTVGQDLASIYSTSVELVVPEQTSGNTTTWADTLASAAYIGQSMASQTGFTKVAAYTLATRISVANYWGTGYNNSVNAVEVGMAYCYFYYAQSTPCQSAYASQQAAMNAKMNSSLTPSLGVNNIPTMVTQLQTWEAFGKNCSNGSRPGGCTLNANFPLMMYEGGFAEGEQTSDMTQSLTSATNASTAVLSVAGNGCIAGQTVALSSLTGGTWSTASGSYTVQASGTDSSHCAINLNSTGLGTLSGATLTYTGSFNYVNYLRLATYLQSSLTTLTTTVYNYIVANGGINPSQFDLAGTYGGNSANGGGAWYVTNPSNYLTPGYPLASCTGCTISGSTMTLGGTLLGIFASGQIISGNGVTSNSIVNSCSTSGSGPCGSNSGDTLGLSQSSTVSSATTMNGSVLPTTITGPPTTISPVTAFKAICVWNNNAAMCQ